MKIIALAVYNEIDNIRELLFRLIVQNVDYIIILDNDSQNGTKVAIEEIAQKYPHIITLLRYKDLTIGEAYKIVLEYACAAAKNMADTAADIRIIQMDAGLTHLPEDIHAMCNIDADLVIGSRFCKSTKFLGWRTLLSKAAALLYFYTRISDVTSGFRVWRPNALQYALRFVNAKGFAFQEQSLLAVVSKRLSIIEYPIEYRLTNSSLKIWMIGEAVWIGIKNLFRRQS